MSVYTTPTEMTVRCSQAGVLLRADHDPAALDQSMEWGSREVDFYILNRYPTVNIPGNAWVQYAACVCAVYHLCWTRLNAVPEVVKKTRDDILDKLKQIANGSAVLPGAPAPNSAPALVNQRVALGSYPYIVTESGRSVGPGVPPNRVNDPLQPPPGYRI